MTKILVNIKRRRGALIVGDPPCDGIILDIGQCMGITVLNCTHSLKGKSGAILARQWLHGGGSRLLTLLTRVNVPTEKKEAFTNISKAQFKAEFERACNPRKIGLGSKQTRLCNIL